MKDWYYLTDPETGREMEGCQYMTSEEADGSNAFLERQGTRWRWKKRETKREWIQGMGWTESH